jgi:nucleoside-diphosphate-sugar epimerase
MKQPRILVTGASGYIGRQVLRWYADKGLDVHATARTPPCTSGGVTWIAADLLDAAERRHLIEAARPTHLLHLAWTTAHGVYWTSPQNIDWLAATLDLARVFGEAGGRRLAGAGTCMEHTIGAGGALGDGPAPERRPLYSVTKYACRMVLDQLAHDLGLGFAWARVFFSYGEHEHPARLVPSVINNLLAGKAADCTSGTQLRDFMHVRDVGAALAALLVSECEGSVDLGTGDGVRIADVVRLVGVLMNKPHLIRLGALPIRPGEPGEMLADGARLRDEVGFVPRYSLEQGLREAIAWWERGPGR